MTGSLSWDLAAKVVLAFIGLLASLIPFAKWMKTYRKNKREKDAVEQVRRLELEMQRQQIAGMRSIAYCFTVMDGMTKGEKRCSDRVVIFNGHNGGQLPEPGRPYYVSAIHSSLEVTRRPEDRPEAMYKKVIVDRHYVNYLLECYQDGHIFIETDTMPNCELKNFYLAEGVTQSIMFFLKTSGTSFVFGSSATIGRKFSDHDVLDNLRSINLMRTSMVDSTRHVTV